MPDQEIIHLHAAGSIPGIPGQHGPGAYVVDKVERTIKRLEDWLAEEAAKLAGPAPAEPAPDGALRILQSSTGSDAVANVMNDLAATIGSEPEATPAPAEAQPDPSVPAPEEARD